MPPGLFVNLNGQDTRANRTRHGNSYLELDHTLFLVRAQP